MTDISAPLPVTQATATPVEAAALPDAPVAEAVVEAPASEEKAAAEQEVAAQNIEAAGSDIEGAAEAEKKAAENEGHTILYLALRDIVKEFQALGVEIKDALAHIGL